MNELNSLSAFGLTLPSPAYLIGSIVFGLLGYVAFRRGRRLSKPELTWAGVELMVYPYAVPVTWAIWLIGAALCGWVYARWD